MKVVIDTNIWISFLLGKTLTALADHIVQGKIRIVLSYDLLAEFIQVVSRPKFKNIFDKGKTEELLTLLESFSIIVTPTQRVDDCRDKKDNIVLEAALAGGAKYIITGDEDLLVLNPYQGVSIIRPKDFELLIAE